MNQIIRTVEDIDPADKADLRVLDIETGQVKHYPSQIRNIDERGIAVSMPTDDRAGGSILEGASVEISIWKGYADHRFKSRVLKRVEGKGLILSRPNSEEIVCTPRRQAFRVGTQISASITHTVQKGPVRATILNMSVSGSRVETTELIHRQTPVVLSFDLPDLIGDSGKNSERSLCQIAGVIKWVDTSPGAEAAKESEPYVHGVGFTDVGNLASLALLRYIAFRQRELIGQIVGAQSDRSAALPSSTLLYEVRDALGQTEQQIRNLEDHTSDQTQPDDTGNEVGPAREQTAHRAVSGKESIKDPTDVPPVASVVAPRGKPRNKTILVVDPALEARKILSQALSNEGYHTVEASDGEEALNIVRSVRIDLVIADRMSGEMDGLDLASDLRAHSPGVPVILMTDEILDEEDEKSAAEHIAGYLEKPVVLNRFLQLTYRTLFPGGENQTSRILVVDDEEDMRLYTGTLLRKAGFEVETVDNGQTGLRKAVTFKPDLILLDIVMPGMQGFEVCERLRARSSTADIPILLLTAKNAPAYVHQAIALKANGYIVKPFDPQELVLRVRLALQRAQNP